jgi:hypothetical protein
LPDLSAAIEGLETPLLEHFMPPLILENLAATKSQERDLFDKLSDHDALMALIDAA